MDWVGRNEDKERQNGKHRKRWGIEIGQVSLIYKVKLIIVGIGPFLKCSAAKPNQGL
jgi:hypothetical protein